MTMTLQEISDRMEINNLLIDYCTAVDARDFAAFDAIFTEDAFIDYTALGGPSGTRAEIKAAGGEAVANYDTVATPEGGKAIIDTSRTALLGASQGGILGGVAGAADHKPGQPRRRRPARQARRRSTSPGPRPVLRSRPTPDRRLQRPALPHSRLTSI